MSQPGTLRVMLEKDISSVMQIQAEAYAEVMQESEAVIRARFAVAPETSWVVEREGNVCAYLVAYKSISGVVSPWGSEFCHKMHANTLYVHDLALGVAARGLRMGHWLVEQVLVQARLLGMDFAVLVSVQDSQIFWRKMGFETYIGLTTSQQQNLESYAGDAFYMVRSLA